MNQITELTLLYDFYGEMLTKRQQEVYEDYHLNDCSLAEVAEELGISRAAVHDNLKRSEKALHHYEERLGLIKRYLENKKVIEDIMKISFETNEKEALIKIRELVSAVLETL